MILATSLTKEGGQMDKLNLYLVNADGNDLEPNAHDLFVRAYTPTQAVRFWQTYHETDDEPNRVDEIPDSGLGAIPWQDVPAVWFKKEAA